jgi:hypothetical protein
MKMNNTTEVISLPLRMNETNEIFLTLGFYFFNGEN